VSRAYRDFLADMVVHARDAIACVEGHTVEEVAADRLRRLALERCFEALGEAAGKIPPDLRARHPDLPWADMIAVRHRVAHAYFQVDVAILHRTARDLLPALVPALERMRDEVAAAEGTPGDGLPPA
jgi:uncharacterized protein with HEPN domain